MQNHATESSESAKTEGSRVVIRLNGDVLELPADTTISRLVEILNLKGDRIAVELDRRIVHRNDWETTRIRSGAEVEVVHFVGGG